MSASLRGRTLRRSLGAAGLSGLVAAGLLLSIGTAEAATLFGADFESGSTSGWSKSGGTWSVVSDGTSVLAQSDTGSERARQFAGNTSWTNYSVQARVKATAFGSSAGVVALTGRAAGSTKMYRLSLTGANRVQLETMNGSAVTVLGSLAQTISPGTYYTLKLSFSGTTISGSVNGAGVGSVTDSTIAAGRIGLLTENAAGRFDDVVVDDGVSTPPLRRRPRRRPRRRAVRPPPPARRRPQAPSTWPRRDGQRGRHHLRADHADLGDHADRRGRHDLPARWHLRALGDGHRPGRQQRVVRRAEDDLGVPR
ncbi:family 16 glycoside hydrolase [Actinoplanes sp. CA-252034]|uniref:family 16 glycoside hydrolase n=1 Tax=Actinoplanes sp. CA-252034 TaxID=3239906 RepID=UPI003D951C2D